MIVLTREQEVEREILSMMTADTHKLAVAVGYPMTEEAQAAFERLQLRDWVRLIDLSSIASLPGTFRIFRVMPPAVEWFRNTLPRMPSITTT